MKESARARAESSHARISALDPQLRSCIGVREESISEAALIDAGVSRGSLAGWTIGIKDNFDVAGTPRSDGLGPPLPRAAEEDSEAVRRLRAAGAVIVAKTNLEELSFGATTQNRAWGRCRNPWDLTRIPGGSSGGSAVAVAAGLVDAALGTDTGGSLRNPAALCGISALRPTHGWISRRGVTPLSPSMDVVGPMARSVTELRPLLAALTNKGEVPGSSTLSALAVGVHGDYFAEDIDDQVAGSFDALLGLLHSVGARLVNVAFSRVPEVAEAMATLQNAEAAQSLMSYWDDPRVSEGIRERLNIGRSATRRQLEAASQTAESWRVEVADAFEHVDVIVTPATPFVAPPIQNENIVRLSRQINKFTGCWSLAGMPALVVPLQLSANRLPVGGQLIGRKGSDWQLLGICEAIQAASGWHEATPPT